MKKIFTCLFIAALCFGKTQTLLAQVNVQDSLALVDLYNSTNGPGWNKNANWLTAAPVKKWYGITVNNGRVDTVSLCCNQLNGSIPSSLGNLSNVLQLDLSSNLLSGTIPTSLGNLSNLRQLHLASNQLTGTIPSSLGNFSNLVTFLLYNNQLSGTIPSSMGNLSKLQHLQLFSNQLTGAIPSSLGNLFNLQVMSLADNQLSGTIPSSLGNLSNLVSLELPFNQLSDSIPSSLGNLSKLHDLYLASNQLIGKIPSSLGNIPKLYYLNVNDNQLSGPIPSSLYSLPLSSTYLRYNRFTFAGMEGLAKHFYSRDLQYSPQAHIPIIQKNDSVLSVNAGGSLINNTYKWFKDGVLVAKKTGDKNFTTTGPGKYNVVVRNAIATELKLLSDTITITGFSVDKNVISKTNTKAFIYPNPANDIIHLTLDKPASSNTTIVLYNMQGKAMMQQKVTTDLLIQEYSISNLAAGNYLLVIMENGKKIHEERLVIVR